MEQHDIQKFYHNPNHLRHWNNISGTPALPCSHVLSLPYQDRCSFILKTPECHTAVQYFDYLNFIYCTVGAHSESVYIAGVLIVCLLCLYLFTILATTADKFFCPALAVTSKLLKMSENVAGVTLLAFGNGSPDIFASLSQASGDTELMYAQLIGGATFVTGFVAGLIIFLRPFKIIRRNYTRDVLFFISAATFIYASAHDHKYTIYEGFTTVGLYVIYIIYVVVDHIRMKRKAEELRKLSDAITAQGQSDEDILRMTEVLEDATEIKIHSRKDSSIILDEEILSVFRRKLSGGANKDLLRTFVRAMNPINELEWRDGGWMSRTVMIIQSPIIFVLSLVIPIVDYSEDLHGWSKLLNMLNILTLPQFALIVTELFTLMIFNYVPLSAIVFVISFGFAVAVHFTSRNDCPPRYHAVFAAGNFVGSICVIYTVAQEVVSVMKAFGIISDMTDSFVGLSILAYGNSIGDVFSNTALARQGYQQMAFAACFGGPILNSLLGAGLTFTLKAFNAPGNIAYTREGAMGPNCILFLLLNLSTAFLALNFTNFNARKSIGIFMIIIYFIFILFALLGELEVVHPFGTDHEKLDREIQ